MLCEVVLVPVSYLANCQLASCYTTQHLVQQLLGLVGCQRQQLTAMHFAKQPQVNVTV